MLLKIKKKVLISKIKESYKFKIYYIMFKSFNLKHTTKV